MTVEQIEQLAANRSQREGGQRLGSADSAPWQYHPELGAVAAGQLITLRIGSLVGRVRLSTCNAACQVGSTCMLPSWCWWVGWLVLPDQPINQNCDCMCMPVWI